MVEIARVPEPGQACGGGVFWTAGPATFLRTAGVGEPAPTIQAPVGRTLTPVRSPRQHREEENVRDGTTRRAPMGRPKGGGTDGNADAGRMVVRDEWADHWWQLWASSPRRSPKGME